MLDMFTIHLLLERIVGIIDVIDDTLIENVLKPWRKVSAEYGPCCLWFDVVGLTAETVLQSVVEGWIKTMAYCSMNICDAIIFSTRIRLGEHRDT